MFEQQLDELRAELAASRAQVEQLRQSNEQLQKCLRDKSDVIRQAKDINPVGRVSLRRVLILAHAAFLDISKIAKVDGGGWLLSMGTTSRRKFKSLRQIWELLNVEDWFLSDLFDETLVVKPKLRSRNKGISSAFDFANSLIGGARQNSFDVWNHFTVDAYGDISSG